MSPNAVESSLQIESVSDMSKVGNGNSAPAEVSNQRYMLLLTQSTLNITAYVLLGILVGINLQFAYRFGPNLSNLNLHIVLCVLGYQLLMAVGILTLTSESGFAANITLKHRRWIHTFLQIAGSTLAIAGSTVMSLVKPVNFDTLHGKFSLAAMAFTIACLFNGLASLYFYELRKCLPGNFSKLTHILFGIVAFSMASVSLAYGFHKNSFRNWATHHFVTVLFILTGVYTAIIIINPFITFFSKLNNVIKKD